MSWWRDYWVLPLELERLDGTTVTEDVVVYASVTPGQWDSFEEPGVDPSAEVTDVFLLAAPCTRVLVTPEQRTRLEERIAGLVGFVS